MAKDLESEIHFYRDSRDKLKRTSSGHFRFDIKFNRTDGTPYVTVQGFRFDMRQKRIIPPTISSNMGVLVVAQVEPEELKNLCQWLYDEIWQELDDQERFAATGRLV
jgi:hypothetical protein